MRKLACILAVVGCGGGGSTNVKPTLKFADQPDATIERLIGAAGGGDMFGAQSMVDQFAGGSDACPAVAASGDTITLTGGCTTQDGVALGGTVTITNPTSWDQVMYNYTAPTEYELTGFSTTQSGSVMIDGRITISSNFTVYDADITTNMLGIEVRSDLHYECDAGSKTCSLSGSGLELVGVGGALVGGTVNVGGQSASASYTLRGVDTLKSTLMNSCEAWSISGSTRAKTCP